MILDVQLMLVIRATLYINHTRTPNRILPFVLIVVQNFFGKLVSPGKYIIARKHRRDIPFETAKNNRTEKTNDNAIVCGYPDTRLYEYFYVKVQSE